MLTLRKTVPADLDFLVEVDRKDWADTDAWDAETVAGHREKIEAFVGDAEKDAWVVEDTDAGRLVGVILWRFRNRLEDLETWSIIGRLDAGLFPPDGAFCEIFQLWVAPEHRRRGLATRMKRQAETESLRRGVKMIYTHTEEGKAHVIEMNRKLGYREVHRGPMWDETVRVSLVKRLG